MFCVFVSTDAETNLPTGLSASGLPLPTSVTPTWQLRKIRFTRRAHCRSLAFRAAFRSAAVDFFVNADLAARPITGCGATGVMRRCKVKTCSFWVAAAMLAVCGSAAAQYPAASPYSPIPLNPGAAVLQSPGGALPSYPAPSNSCAGAVQVPAGPAPSGPITSSSAAGQLPPGSSVSPLSSPPNGTSASVGRFENMSPALADSRVWFSAEYLLWWLKGGNVPPLVTTSPPASTGTLGQPGTVVLFGPGSDVERSPISGGRFTAGCWLDECCTFGLEGNYFFLVPRRQSIRCQRRRRRPTPAPRSCPTVLQHGNRQGGL